MKSKSKVDEKLFKKEALEKDVLNRIKWDASLDAKDFILTYSDRFLREEKKVPVTEITVDGEFFKHKESLIPLHRIRKILHKNRVVWDKRRIK